MNTETADKPTTADKMLASIRRGVEMPPAALRRMGAEQPQPTQPEKPEKPAAKKADLRAAAVQRQVDFDVSTGRGIKHLTIRVPKEMAADLALLAMRNKLSENGGPTTINELGIRALQRLLDAA